jgi:hypothetical protein
MKNIVKVDLACVFSLFKCVYWKNEGKISIGKCCSESFCFHLLFTSLSMLCVIIVLNISPHQYIISSDSPVLLIFEEENNIRPWQLCVGWRSWIQGKLVFLWGWEDTLPVHSSLPLQRDCFLVKDHDNYLSS